MQGDHSSQLRRRIHEIIFEANTPMGKAFDITLLILIVASIIILMLESVEPLREPHHIFFAISEWIITIAFTIEYALRLYSVKKPLKYATSFYGIIDLISILPTYISIFLPGSQYILVVRAFRLLRVFRIFKAARFVEGSYTIMRAIRASQHKIVVFIGFVFTAVIVIGSIMYLVEGGRNGFDNIPKCMYWAVVTLTTVGYGDIVPITALGKMLSAVLMVMGYGIIAVPTGIVTAELTRDNLTKKNNTESCPNCSEEGHDTNAKHCKFCGHLLNE